MDINELKELIRLLEDSALSEIEIEDDDRRIRLSKQWPGAAAPVHMHVPVAAPAAPAPAPAAAPAPSAPPAEAESALPHGSYTIDSPMVGTFYAAASPGDPPFVLPGTAVGAEQTVCIVEAMKIMNEVTSKEACIIEKVLVENGQPVEFGQPLFQARPVA